MQANSRVKRVEVSAVVTRSGKTENLGTIALWERRNPWLWGVFAVLAIALSLLLHSALGLLLGASLIVNTGRAIVTNRIKGAGTEPSFVAWGTGAGITAQTDTTLFTEGPEARVAGTSTQQTVTTANDTYQVVGTISASATRTVTNAGLFDAVTVGNLYAKSDFTGIVLPSAGDSIQFTFKVTYS